MVVLEFDADKFLFYEDLKNFFLIIDYECDKYYYRIRFAIRVLTTICYAESFKSLRTIFFLNYNKITKIVVK